jgi:hypothetical protein
VTKIVEVGLETIVCFTEMDKASNKQHRIWMQIADAYLIVVVEPLQEWMYGNTKSMSKVFFKHNNFTSFRIWEWL